MKDLSLHKRKPCIPYTKKEDWFIKKYLNKIPIRQFAKMMNRHQGSVKSRIKILRLVKDPEIQAMHLKLSWFKKGHVPPNTGKRMQDFMSKEQYENFIAHRFVKGHPSHNKMEEGSIVIKKMGKKVIQNYYAIKVNGKWPLLHRYLWEQAFGPVPAGMVVSFENGNQMDCRLENLQLISMTENMMRNTIHTLPVEVVESIHQLRKYKNKLTKYEKQIC